MPLNLLTLNVGAPSLERAQRQLAWLAARPESLRDFALAWTVTPLFGALVAALVYAAAA